MKIKSLKIGYKTELLSISTLELEAGNLYALVGGNGRGKTTLLHTLMGNISPLSGEIEVEGNKLVRLNTAEKARTFGFVQSRFEGIAYMRAWEYVALGRHPHTNAFGRLSEKDITLVNTSLEMMQIRHLAQKFTTEMSDGERQMLAIAKVLAQETQYIFLDEPTAFLDYSNKKKVLELLQKIAREHHKHILYSSHDLEMVLHYSNGMIFVPSRSNDVQFVSTPDSSLKKIIYACFESND